MLGADGKEEEEMLAAAGKAEDESPDGEQLADAQVLFLLDSKVSPVSCNHSTGSKT